MTAQLLEPDRNQLEIFIDALFRHAGDQGFVSVRSFYENDTKSFRITPASLAGGFKFLVEVAEDDSRRAANEPRPVVFCPPVAIFANDKHAREQDIALGLAITVECDSHAQEARAKLEQLLGPATLVVRSGGQWTDANTGEVGDKLHLHYRAKTPAGDKEQLAKMKYARILATNLVGGDASNKPICHPIRWPGSWHRKSAPKLCEIESAFPDNEIDLDEALKKLNGGWPPPGGWEQYAPDAGPGPGSRPRGGGEDALDWSDSFGKIITGKEFHPVLVPLAASFAAKGTPEPVARGVLGALLNNTQTTDPERLRRRDVELSKLGQTIRSGYQKFGQGGELFDPWARYIVPKFPLDVLPTMLQDFVSAQSNVIGCCQATMGMSTLATLSAAIDHGFALKMMRHGTWYAHPRLWVLLIGDVSAGKTPGMNAATAPLERRQARLYREYKDALRNHKESGGKKEDEPEPPPCYVVNDSTTEKLGEILARSDRGLLVKRDELTGWIGQMDKYSHATHASGDRGFWLKAFDGGFYAVERVKRGMIPVGNLSVSVIGSIQPERFSELRGLTSDGLLQRFLAVIMGEAKFTCDEPVNQNAYWALIDELIKLPARHLSMTDDAHNTITDLRQQIFNLARDVKGFSGGLQGFLGKLAGYTGSLALILHLAEFPKERFVGGKVANNVRRLVVDFLIPHSFEFYNLGETSEQLKRLASYILTCGKDRILASDLTTNVRDCRELSLYQIGERVSPLVAGGWVVPVDRTPTCRAWLVNPAVRVRFEEQRQKEEERKRNITEMLREKRRASATST